MRFELHVRLLGRALLIASLFGVLAQKVDFDEFGCFLLCIIENAVLDFGVGGTDRPI